MTWLDHRDHIDTTGGRLRVSAAVRDRGLCEQAFTIPQVAAMMNVTRETVYKWLALDDPGSAVIPPDGWFRRPATGKRSEGYILIKKWVVQKLYSGEM